MSKRYILVEIDLETSPFPDPSDWVDAILDGQGVRYVDVTYVIPQHLALADALDDLEDRT